MKQVEKLLQEYKIRFNVTDKIKDSKNLGGYTSMIGFNVVFNKNGKVYKNGVWATADVKELPEKWVVEKDETSPLWEQFEKWSRFPLTLPEKNDKYFSISADKKSIIRNEELIFFEEHQYLTLEQWAEFCLPKKENMIMAELIFKIDEFRATSKPETFEIKTSDVKVIEKDNKLFYSGEGLIFDELMSFEFEYEPEIDKIKECDVLIDGKHTFKLIDIRKDIENIYLENYKKPVHQIIIYVLTCQNK